MTTRIGEEIFWKDKGNYKKFHLFQTTLRVCLVMFSFEVLLVNVFFLEIFLEESLVKCFRKHYKRFFNILNVFSKFY